MPKEPQTMQEALEELRKATGEFAAAVVKAFEPYMDALAKLLEEKPKGK